MSTLDGPDLRAAPPLRAGERLDQAAFHRRYEAMPAGAWAELVGGSVRMPSPLFDDHGGTGDVVAFWLGLYRRSTPGLRSSANATTILGPSTEVQPDHQLRLGPAQGGRARVVGGYVEGPPELVIEVSRSSRAFDLGPKKRDYARAGVPEYLVVELGPDRLHWFVLREGRYERLEADETGVFRSEIFPGLWLDADALYADDLGRVSAALERGLASPEHAVFLARLAALEGPAG